MQRRVALVTGAARRLGAEIARHLGSAGYATVVHYHTSTDAAEDVAFSELDDGFTCPVCYAGKEEFEKLCGNEGFEKLCGTRNSQSNEMSASQILPL